MKTTFSRDAFTLIEILVVLVIMGFLVAMVSPKLVGVISSSGNTLDDTNQKELTKVFHKFASIKERMPRKLLNLVHENNSSSTVVYEVLSVYSADGVAEFSKDFIQKLVPTLHHLNAEEVLELKRLGIMSVRNYKYTNNTNSIEYNRNAKVVEGLGVLMLGCGADSSGVFDWSSSLEGSVNDDGFNPPIYNKTTNVAFDNDSTDVYAYSDTAAYLGRIILGVDSDNELVTKGFIDKSATSPKEASNEDIRYHSYSVLVPRLSATVTRMENHNSKVKLHLKKYDKALKDRYTKEIIEMQERQDLGDITIVSPQGFVSKNKNFSYGVKIE